MKDSALIKNLSSDLRPFQSVESLTSFLKRWVLFLIVTLTISFLILPFRDDMPQKWHEVSFHFENLLWLGLANIAAIAVYFSSFPQKMNRKINFVGSSIVASLFFWAILKPGEQYSVQHLLSELDYYRGGCGLIILVIAVAQSSILLSWMKSGAPRKLTTVGLWSSLSGGALGSLLMQVACARDNSLHLILWHLIPLSLACFIGQIITRKILRW